MALPKFKRLVVNLADVIVDRVLNFREQNDRAYDLPQMADSIVAAGRILNAPVIEWWVDPADGVKKLRTLQGHRRISAAQLLLTSADCPDEVKAALRKCECILYENLDDNQRLELVLDHDTKGLNRTETVKAVWRLASAGYGEREIIKRMYQLLARYTRNEAKLFEVPADGPGREQALYKRFHGTVGDSILLAFSMPQFVRDAYIEMHHVQDGILKKEDAKSGVWCSAPRLKVLRTIRKAANDAGKWDNDNPCKEFMDQWELFRKEDAGEAQSETLVRPNNEALDARIANHRSEAVKMAFRNAKGEKVSLLDLDERTYKEQIVFQTLYEVSGNGGVRAEFSELVKAMLAGDTAKVKALIHA